MWSRRALSLLPNRNFCSSPSSPEAPSLYSFLQPSLFALKPSPSPSPPSDADQPSKSLSLDKKSALEDAINQSLCAHDTDEAWKSFKALTNHSSYPSKSLTNSLITHLSSCNDVHNLKRAFASVVYLIEKNPNSLEFSTINSVMKSLLVCNVPAPAFSLVKSMFKNRYLVPFGIWGHLLAEISRKNGSFSGYLTAFNENCRIALDENLDFMKPDLASCNAALEGCCFHLESVSDADHVVGLMWRLGVKPDESSLGSLAYLYALSGLEEKINELEHLMDAFGFTNRTGFVSNMIKGYVNSGNFEAVSKQLLKSLGEEANGQKGLRFSEETYSQILLGFTNSNDFQGLAELIIQSQLLEDDSIASERSVGFHIISACVNFGMLDKAHSVLDEMKARGAVIGVGIYISILKAYCKDRRTAEAVQLVSEISDSGLTLDATCYDALIEASMSSQDFQSAFSFFRAMRDSRISDLQGGYLTIMTGLTENNRPELMAAFLDDVVGDPRVVVGTHDWNSIIHSFCKSGRLEDARRTFRRMMFLRFEPNELTYSSLITGYVSAEKYFSVLLLWNEVKKRASVDRPNGGFVLTHGIIDAFLYALVKGGYFDASMQVIEKSHEMRIFVDKWRYKQAFMETHKKLKINKLRRRNLKKMDALIAFKNWAGLGG